MTDHTKPPDSEDQALVARAKRGDQEAVELLVRGHQGVVFRFLLGLLGDEEDAADATQETFLKALGGLDRFRGEARFRTWLLAIARNEAKGLFRKERSRREDSLDQVPEASQDEEGMDEVLARDGELLRIRQALAHLPKKQRLSVTLRLFDGMSFREIGEAIESSEGAARVNYHHGIRRLREWLEVEPETPRRTGEA